MDFEKTSSFEMGNGKVACLLLHGFSGSPWDLRLLGEHLAAAGYFVKAPRLPGHGTHPEAMAQITYRDWLSASEDALESLSKFRHIFVAGLSMGGLLSLCLAAKFPERIHGLALMAPAMQFQRRPLRVLNTLGMLPFLPLVRPNIKKETTDMEDEIERAASPMLPYFPSARLQCLHTLQGLARRALSGVKSPTLILMAEREHVVKVEGGDEIARGLKHVSNVRLVRVEKGFHIMPRDLGRDVVFYEITEFFESLRGQIHGENAIRSGD